MSARVVVATALLGVKNRPAVRLAFWLLDPAQERSRARERAVQALANRLPREVAYWCTIRVLAHATTGPWGNTEVPALLAMDALQRWNTTPAMVST